MGLRIEPQGGRFSDGGLEDEAESVRRELVIVLIKNDLRRIMSFLNQRRKSDKLRR